MPIAALPPAPSRATDNAVSFSAKADALLGALAAFRNEANALETNVDGLEASATTASQTAVTKAAEAVAAAASAIAAPGTNATSTTSLAIGTGAKAMTIQTGKAFVPGQPVRVARTSDPSGAWMYGDITAHNSGTGALTVNVLATKGAGTFTDWTIFIAGAGVTHDGTETLTGKTFVNATFTNYTETTYTHAAGTAFAINLANGTRQKCPTNGNATITLPASVAGKSYVIDVAYGGAHSVTFAGGGVIKWPGGVTPTATSVNGKIDKYVMDCDGTNTFIRDGGRNF